MSIMRTYHTHFTGAYVAECPTCHRICAGWDDDDLNDDGQLECSCDTTEYGNETACKNCRDEWATLDENGHCPECAAEWATR